MAGAWTRAEALQKAFKDGAAAANLELAQAEETKRKQEESLRNLKAQHG